MDINISADGDNSGAEKINEDNSIQLSPQDIQRIYEPWKFSVIIKLMGKRILHHYLKKKIQDLWRATEKFSLIDLGEDYYIVKFSKEENVIKALQNGPWFINSFFLSVQKWKPNFMASHARQSFTAVWVRLPQLLTEFYDRIILTKIGKKIERLLKIDASLEVQHTNLCPDKKKEDKAEEECTLSSPTMLNKASINSTMDGTIQPLYSDIVTHKASPISENSYSRNYNPKNSNNNLVPSKDSNQNNKEKILDNNIDQVAIEEHVNQIPNSLLEKQYSCMHIDVISIRSS
ncbi:uncharacterized protein [Nicotiana tomentosiformis]|uniref:uncharacterized protein n=1 Tax=Nicotiana tomentosiformis TaxID=4098 RepID=UPI00388CBFCF